MSRLQWHIQVDQLGPSVVEGLNLAAERVSEVAVPLTPIDTGDLRESITVEPATEDSPVAAVYTDLPYATRQHEDLTLHHTEGGAKFLENAGEQVKSELADIVAGAIRRGLGT
jgi:hypothetical protein